MRRESQAYDYIYDQILGSFCQWVYQRNGTQKDAEDAFQRGLLNFFLNLETGKYQFQASAKITSVVFDYCKKIWLNELASSRFQTRATLPTFYDAADDTDLQNDLERSEVVDRVKVAMQQLKEDCRRLLHWFYVDELPLREIADKLGMKESSTKQKRFDCAEKLKKQYVAP